MTPEEFRRLKVGDHVLVRCIVEREPRDGGLVATARAALDNPEEDIFTICREEVIGYATQPHPLDTHADAFIVGDRVRWCSHDGWFIVHLIPETSEAVILHDDAGRGCRRTALSRLERLTS